MERYVAHTDVLQNDKSVLFPHPSPGYSAIVADSTPDSALNSASQSQSSQALSMNSTANQP